MGRLFLLFTLLPLLDLWLLFAIAGVVGFWPALALVVVPGAVGAWLAKSEGRRVLRGWQRAAEAGRVPDEGILSAALVLAGGVLLVSPGVITDTLGLLLLFPPTRRLAASAVRRWLERKIRSGQVRVVTFGRDFRGAGGDGDGGGGDEPIDVTPRRPGSGP